MQFRKKPVVIDAWEFGGGLKAPEWIGEITPVDGPNDVYAQHIAKTENKITSSFGGKLLHIPTLEGVMTAQAGDWIIRGVKGERYPCKPDIFEATYEPA